jgi:hypothetical protein
MHRRNSIIRGHRKLPTVPRLLKVGAGQPFARHKFELKVADPDCWEIILQLDELALVRGSYTDAPAPRPIAATILELSEACS